MLNDKFFKVFGRDAVFCIAYIVTMFKKIAVYVRKLLKTHLIMKVARSSLKSQWEVKNNISSGGVHNDPFTLIDENKMLYQLIPGNLIFVKIIAISHWGFSFFSFFSFVLGICYEVARCMMPTFDHLAEYEWLIVVLSHVGILNSLFLFQTLENS